MIVFPQGGAKRREGTISKRRITASDGSNINQGRLIPFYGSDGTRWQICLTDEIPWYPVVGGDVFFDAGTDANHWPVQNVVDNSVEELTFSVPAEASGILPFQEYYNFAPEALNIRLNEIQYAQSGDTMILAHGKMRPLRIYYDVSNYDSIGSKFTSESLPQTLGPSAAASGSWLTVSGDNVAREIPFLTIGAAFADEGAFTCAVNPGSYATGGADNASLTFTFANTGMVLDDTWLGRILRFSHSSETIVFQIFEIASGTLAYGRWLDGTIAADPTTFSFSEIEQGAWDDKHGWPKTVAFFDSRLVFGGTNYFPDLEWWSKINSVYDFEVRKLEQDPDFADPTAATDAFANTLKQTLYSDIRWMSPEKTLITGTLLSEFVVKGPDTQESIGPLNITSTPETPHGSAYLQAIKNENTTVFLQRDRKSLRELVFNLDEDSFIAPNLNIIGEHIAGKFGLERADADYLFAKTPGAFVAMVKQELPHNTIWCVDNNGCLSGITRDRQQNVAAWHTHELAGESYIENDDLWKAKVESISAIQIPALDDDGTGGEPDELWMLVSRGFTDGGVKGKSFFLEKLAREWDRGKINQNWDFDKDVAPVYMDASIFYDSQAGTSGVIPVPHLQEGQIVGVVQDGYWLGEFTVSSDLTIDISAQLTSDEISGVTPWKAIVGLNYLGKLIPVVPEVQATTGSSQGQIRRIDQITIQFYRSIGARFGRADSINEEVTPVDDLEELDFPEAANTGDPVPLFTGEMSVNFPQSYERRPRLLIESHLPFPCTISHVVARMVVYE